MGYRSIIGFATPAATATATATATAATAAIITTMVIACRWIEIHSAIGILFNAITV